MYFPKTKRESHTSKNSLYSRTSLARIQVPVRVKVRFCVKNPRKGGDFYISTAIFRQVTPREPLQSSFLQQPMRERQVACIPATIARQAPKRERRNPLRVFRRKGWRQTPWRIYLDEGSGMNISSEAAPPPPPPNCQRTPRLGSAFAPDRAF